MSARPPRDLPGLTYRADGPPPARSAGGGLRTGAVVALVLVALGGGLLYWGAAWWLGSLFEDALTDAPAASCRGKNVPDEAPGLDYCADATGTVELDGLSLHAEGLRRGPDGVCATVAVTGNDGPTDVRAQAWRLHWPTGDSRPAVGGTLPRERIGDREAGTVCFGSAPGSGAFALTFSPYGRADMRAVWPLTL